MAAGPPPGALHWRLAAERGLRCYRHSHRPRADGRTPATCELALLLEVALEESARAAEGAQQPPLSYTSATRRAGQFRCVGAIRKAGFLSVKKWILKRRQSIELARKQGWRRYWVCLRGTALLFHAVVEAGPRAPAPGHKQVALASWLRANCAGQPDAGGPAPDADPAQCYIEEEPRHLIIIDGAIAQPIPEHPRKDFVFCLSTTFGDAYLFQASCQSESENWISAIHNACAASIARDLVRDEAVKLFETKIRHFELEADKKLFLRHRLESRLTSMSAMCGLGAQHRPEPEPAAEPRADKTMRALLHLLSQQLLALDSYSEQLHCEIYQLRCYLSSCSAQHAFYQHLAAGGAPAPARSHCNRDLPHPKSLLMHVSKPTKLLLIKLGVFTVSSFHAFIHARQESAKGILESIRQERSPESPLIELRIRSQSVSEALMARPENLRLASDTENLIELSDLRPVTIVLAKALFSKLKQPAGPARDHAPAHDHMDLDEASDELCSLEDCGQSVQLTVKLNASADSPAIIRHVLRLLRPTSGELDFLDYYLRLAAPAAGPAAGECEHFVARRKETLADWSNYQHIELLEKVLFRVELARSRLDEEESAAPFGVSVEGQLLTGAGESLLNVYCSYVEWGSAADKAGLQDEDEFLTLNGVPVADLDLMFVECIVQEAVRLRAVVRSSRRECPAKARRLDPASWRSLDEPDGAGPAAGPSGPPKSGAQDWPGRVSEVISHEYLSSLVCPPPPAKADAFLRTDTNLLRQKSDLGLERRGPGERGHAQADGAQVDEEGRAPHSIGKAVSQHRIDVSAAEDHDCSPELALSSSTDLARQLMQKTERISRLLARDGQTTNPPEPDRSSGADAQSSLASSLDARSSDHGQLERLKKSVLELVETEYAYIRHLETIGEHYLAPLCETAFLAAFDLGPFSQTVADLLKLQRAFFALLTGKLVEQLGPTAERCRLAGDDFERFNWIVQRVDALDSPDGFKPVLGAIAAAFAAEADKFKLYAAYCVAYARLQRLLHPKNAVAQCQGAPTLTSMPGALNVFAAGPGATGGQQRDSRLFSLLGGGGGGGGGGPAVEDRTAQLKQLAEFLANLDSSSSSASLSLQRSSGSDRPSAGPAHARPDAGSKASSSEGANEPAASSAAYQKSAHHQNFESYLIKPIQRLVKYPMLLSSIALAAQAQPGAPAHDELQAAVRLVEAAISHVNESQRVHDEYGPIFERVERQFFEQQAPDSARSAVACLFGPHQPPISLNIARLLFSSPVEWLNAREFGSKADSRMASVLFVFESCVVFVCKEQVRPAGKSRKTPPRGSNDAPAGCGPQAASPPQQQSGSLTSRVLQWSTGGSSGAAAPTAAEPAPSEAVRYQTLIPVSEVQVRSVSHDGKSAPPDAGGPARFQWELFQCSSSNSNSGLLTKTSAGAGKQPAAQPQPQQPQLQQHRNSNTGRIYLLSSPSNEQRSACLRKIRFTIRESVRNMSLPTAGSAKSSFSNKSPALKKLSISSVSSATSANTNVNTSGSLSPPESSGGPDLVTQDQSTTIKCEPYDTKKVHEPGIEVRS